MTDQEQQPVESLPLFPLASVVLFPHIQIPLYIFEPRYREMTEAALRGNRMIGMVTVVPDQLDDMSGDPAVFPIGCAGHIESFERREDGSYDIVIEGVSRFEIDHEPARPEGQGYREARVHLLAEAETADDDPEIRRLRAEVHRRYGELLARVAPDYIEQFQSDIFEAIPDTVYVNTVSLSLDIDAIEKQSLLESPTTRERLERVIVVLDFQLAESQTHGSSNPATLQ